MMDIPQPAVVLAALSCLAVVAAGCGFDGSSGASQERSCRDAVVGHTTRSGLRAALGAPTITDHEQRDGRRVVVDVWLDGQVAFEFDERSQVLVEKGCR